MTDSLQDLADKQAIRDSIYTYCRAVDRIDIPLGHSVFHDDSVADYGADFYHGPGRGVIDLICAHHAHLLSHSHQVTNILIALHKEQAGRARAGSESYVTGSIRTQREGKEMQIDISARYLDAWEKRDGRWGIVRRKVLTDHQSIRDVIPMPSHMGGAMRDVSDPSYAFLADNRSAE